MNFLYLFLLLYVCVAIATSTTTCPLINDKSEFWGPDWGMQNCDMIRVRDCVTFPVCVNNNNNNNIGNNNPPANRILSLLRCFDTSTTTDQLQPVLLFVNSTHVNIPLVSCFISTQQEWITKHNHVVALL